MEDDALAGVGIAPHAFSTKSNQTMLKGTLMDMAKRIAIDEGRRVLVLTGRLDGASGLPAEMAGHAGGFRLRALGAYTSSIPTAAFEIIDEDALCAVIDRLQEQGGYKAQVLNEHGQQDPHYTL